MVSGDGMNETVNGGESVSGGVDITPRQDGGVLKNIIKEGTGETTPASGCNVYVHYEGRLTDGTIFDSSRDRSSPFDFQLGKGKVIRGWDVGVATMKLGEVAVFTIREDYGYGASGSPPKIPPKATLIFEVELLEFEPENLSGKKDKGILRYPIKPGTNFESPKNMAEVEISLRGEHEGKVFDERDVSFMLGTGSTLGIPSGIEKALESFTLNETSKIELKPKYGFGSSGNEKFGIPPDANLTYIVTLKKFQKLKDKWLMEPEEKIVEAQLLKTKGTEYFKKEDYRLALKVYKQSIEYIDSDAGFSDEQNLERKKVLIAGHLNVSLCLLKLNRQLEAVSNCNSVLELDPSNQKALFRRGQAFLAMSEPEKAKKDFERVVELDPNNKAAVAQIQTCNVVQKKIHQKEKKMYADMFEKFAQKDREKEEEERKKQPDVMKGCFGEWGDDERQREPSDFEKENPDILMLEGSGDFKNM